MEHAASDEWWRTAVIYQIYPRSFADANGDGIGDLPGITAHLRDLAELGVDAVWLSPFYRSPQKDAGYDVADYCDVDPLFGTLADFDDMLARAHELGLRVIVDLVPNHSSVAHPWFREALASLPGSPERARYHFRDGRGPNGDEPPNNWSSVFGGQAWTRITEPDGTPGQWYLHLFDSSQPDFDWDNPSVREQFLDVLRFWLDRGVDGFRVDVAHGLAKAEGLPDRDESLPPNSGPFWAQAGVHEIYRDWRALLDTYPGERILCAEAWVEPLTRLAAWVRPDEMHQAFNFPYLTCDWDPKALREVIDDSLAAFSSVGAPSTWVLSNHDVIRHATRLHLAIGKELQIEGIGPRTEGLPDAAAALRRARAATLLMLALPGSAYLYQGEELGLPEVADIPDESRQDPAWFRTGGERYGRDGCRVPLPWHADSPAYGFNDTGASWLPQPPAWADLARDRQSDVAGSTLRLYQEALRHRSGCGLGTGDLTWLESEGSEGTVLAFANGELRITANLGDTPVALPAAATVLLRSAVAVQDSAVGADETVWWVPANADSGEDGAHERE